MNTNDLLNFLDDWDAANRRDEERFWKREKARMLAELEDDDMADPSNGRKESPPPQRRPRLFGRIFGRDEDRGEDR